MFVYKRSGVCYLENLFCIWSIKGGRSHRRHVQSCDRGQDAVKRSRHFLGVGQMVKHCVGALSQYHLAIKRRGRAFAHAQQIHGQRVKGNNLAWSSGQDHFSTVKNLDPGYSSGHGAYGSDPPLSISGRLRLRTATTITGYDSDGLYCIMLPIRSHERLMI